MGKFVQFYDAIPDAMKFFCMKDKTAPALPEAKMLLQPARAAASVSLLAAWSWLVLRGYGDPAPFVFNDEFGTLAGTLPGAMCCLCFQVILRKTPPYGMLWNLGCVALCCPAFLDIFAALRSHGIVEVILNIITGFGFAATFTAIAAQMNMLTTNGLIAASCGGLIFGCGLIQGVLLLNNDSLVLMPVVIALLLRLIGGNPDFRHTIPEKNAVNFKVKCGMLAIFVVAGFSFGLYGSMLAVMIPLLPRPYMPMAVTFAAATCVSGVSIYMARRNLFWRIGLLVCPFILIGYTAWPILHRESPAISLISLHLANIFMATLTTITVFYSDDHPRRPAVPTIDKLFSINCSGLLFGIICGLCLMPVVRNAFSLGIAINYLFALLSLTILISCWSMIYSLGKMKFWKLKIISMNKNSTEQNLSAEEAEEDENKIRESYEMIFSEMRLTRQQSVVAAYLAVKKDDAFICAALSISPNTLKTHVRNILQRLNINSRYELPWLASRTYQEHVHRRQA